MHLDEIGAGIKREFPVPRLFAFRVARRVIQVATEDADSVGSHARRIIHHRATPRVGVEVRQRGEVPCVVVGSQSITAGDAVHPVEEDRKVILDIAALDAGAKLVRAGFESGLEALLSRDGRQSVADLFVCPFEYEVVNLR